MTSIDKKTRSPALNDSSREVKGADSFLSEITYLSSVFFAKRPFIFCLIF